MTRFSRPPLVVEMPALAPNLEPVPADALRRDIAARAPFEASAQRFIRNGGPAERVSRLAGSVASHLSSPRKIQR